MGIAGLLLSPQQIAKFVHPSELIGLVAALLTRKRGSATQPSIGFNSDIVIYRWHQMWPDLLYRRQVTASCRVRAIFSTIIEPLCFWDYFACRRDRHRRLPTTAALPGLWSFTCVACCRPRFSAAWCQQLSRQMTQVHSGWSRPSRSAEDETSD